MTPEARGLLGLALATGIVFLATPFAMRVAARFDFYDRPAGYKGHAAPTPYLGGAPVVLAFVTVILLLGSDWKRTLPIVGGVVVLWGLGTLDDRRTVPPGIRVAVEAALAALLVAADAGWSVGGGAVVGLVVTVVWVVAVVNAMNLFDNMDGSAASIALVISAALAVIGLARGDVWLAVAGAGLAGGCLGFLPHNLSSPARIFLGDGGSMPIGFAIAAMTIGAAGDEAPGWPGLAVGLLLVGIPALDTCLVVASRRRRGISILTGGRDHLTHRTLGRLRTTRGVAVVLGASQALLAALAFLASRQSTTFLVGVVLLYVMAAATAIFVLDSESRAPVEPAGAAEPAPPPERAPARGGRRLETALLIVLGAGAGISPFVAGFYHSGAWVPIGLGLLVLAVAATVARAGRVSGLGLAAVAGLAGLGLLSILSSSWSGSAENAVVNGNRLLVYAAFLALLLALVRSRTDALVVAAAFVGGALVVGVVDVIRLLGADAGGLFLGGRLNGPLGYINGQGDFFLLAAWPCIALAEQRRRPWLAAAGLGAATLTVTLAALAQSRGVALAALISVIVVLVVVPGRLRRAAALLVLGFGIAVAAPTLVHVYTKAAGGAVPDSAARHAGLAILLASVAVAAAWRVALALESSVRRRGPAAIDTSRLALAGALGVLILGGVVVGAVRAGAISEEVSRQYDAFVHLDSTQGSTGSQGRLVSGGGNRFDYWRIAADAWKGHPVAGIGAGGYPEPYFERRRTTEDIRQPHSIELEVLAELGIIGAALLLGVVAAVAAAAARRRREAARSLAERGVLTAAVGVIVAWGVHTSVDWMHLLPGVTAAALIAAAALLRTHGAGRPARAARGARLAVLAVVAVAVAITATSLSRQFLADYTRQRGQDALAHDPAGAVRWANRSLKLDGDATATYYLKAAALARFGSGPASAAVLGQAIGREPGNFLTYALLGDLEVRRGRPASARRAYGRALALNPRDAGLRALARNPTAAAPNGVR